mmetsp:Transcript_17735/g.40133  ORF Transcript_17735/g.40133 Transcript_17735/m.40133 type:complete len:351 (-) Transcript_17735:28-1080(-)
MADVPQVLSHLLQHFIVVLPYVFDSLPLRLDLLMLFFSDKTFRLFHPLSLLSFLHRLPHRRGTVAIRRSGLGSASSLFLFPCEVQPLPRNAGERSPLEAVGFKEGASFDPRSDQLSSWGVAARSDVRVVDEVHGLLVEARKKSDAGDVKHAPPLDRNMQPPVLDVADRFEMLDGVKSPDRNDQVVACCASKPSSVSLARSWKVQQPWFHVRLLLVCPPVSADRLPHAAPHPPGHVSPEDSLNQHRAVFPLLQPLRPIWFLEEVSSIVARSLILKRADGEVMLEAYIHTAVRPSLSSSSWMEMIWIVVLVIPSSPFLLQAAMIRHLPLLVLLLPLFPLLVLKVLVVACHFR